MKFYHFYNIYTDEHCYARYLTNLRTARDLLSELINKKGYVLKTELAIGDIYNWYLESALTQKTEPVVQNYEIKMKDKNKNPTSVYDILQSMSGMFNNLVPYIDSNGNAHLVDATKIKTQNNF